MKENDNENQATTEKRDFIDIVIRFTLYPTIYVLTILTYILAIVEYFIMLPFHEDWDKHFMCYCEKHNINVTENYPHLFSYIWIIKVMNKDR